MRYARLSSLIAGVAALAMFFDVGGMAAAPRAAPAAGPQEVLSGTYPNGISLAIDSGGVRHVVAGKRNGDLWYATDRGNSWSSKRILKGSRCDGAWSRPVIAIDDRDRLHVATVRGYPCDVPGGTAGIWYITDKGRARGSFGPKVRVAGKNMTDPALRVTGGVRYLAFARRPTSPLQTKWPLYFKTDRSGSWALERIWGRGSSPSLRVDARGSAHVVFDAGKNVRYTRARTAAGDFAKPVVISAGKQPLRDGPSIALAPTGRPHVVWPAITGGTARIWYAVRSTSGWKAPVAIGRGFSAEISMDAAGRPHVAIGSMKRVFHRWRTTDGWRGRLVASATETGEVRIRVFGGVTTLAWSVSRIGGGVWVATD